MFLVFRYLKLIVLFLDSCQWQSLLQSQKKTCWSTTPTCPIMLTESRMSSIRIGLSYFQRKIKIEFISRNSRTSWGHWRSSLQDFREHFVVLCFNFMFCYLTRHNNILNVNTYSTILLFCFTGAFPWVRVSALPRRGGR